MSWGLPRAESSGSTSAWPNQVTYSYNYGPSASLFEHAENTTFTNSQINTHITQIQARSTGLDVLGKNSALGAIYNSLERQKLDAPKCHPNTRRAVIDRIIDWLIGDIDLDALILWLYGAAGAGKSAISHSIAEICEKYGWLLASFFFWKTAGERNNINRFVASIAHQVSLSIPASRVFVGAAVNENPFIFQQSVDVQLAKLVIEPLQRLHSTGFDFKASAFVMIVDGLDECQGNEIQSVLVKSLAAAFCDSPFRIRILIASRPEVYLQSTFNSSSIKPHISHLALSNKYSPEEEIYRFLEDSFDKIRREHPLASYIPSSWPSADVLHELTRKSSGQFIFASTTIKYIGGDPRQLPHHRLDIIRSLRSPKGEKDMPYAELNSLYHHVLCNVDDIIAVKQILGVLIIVNPELDELGMYTPEEVDGFLFWERGETKACLSQLASVIECDTDERISILHASLSDFLLDPSRSQQFYLCRESILGNSASLGLRHLHKQGCDENNFVRYTFFTDSCFRVGLCCTPQLQEELSQLSFQTLYRFCEIPTVAEVFCNLSREIIKMLDKRNLQEQFAHLISDLQAVCLRTENICQDEDLLSLIYEVQNFHILQVEASEPASVFPLWPYDEYRENFHWVVMILFTRHPQYQRLEFTEEHYTKVAEYIIGHTFLPHFKSADEFHMADDEKKRKHSKKLSLLLYLPHVLPRACKHKRIRKFIFHPEASSVWGPMNFHADITLDGWNDPIIQPALDAVLDYYKRYADPPYLEEYMRLNNLS